MAAVPKRAGARAWATFWDNREPLGNLTRAHPFADSVQLFHQSTRAYDAGAFDLASLGCRASLESACFVFLTTSKVSDGAWATSSLRKLDGTARRVTFTELFEGVKARRVLRKEQLEELDAIKEHGDFVAHMSEAPERHMGAFAQNLPALIASSPDRPPEFEKGFSPLEIERDLVAGANILLTLGAALNHGGG